MIKLSVAWGGSIELAEQRIEELTRQADLSLIYGLNFVGRSMQQRAIGKIRGGTKTGQIYERFNPSRMVQASAPGEAPADDTGELAAGIQLRGLNTMDVTVAATAPHSEVLELGGVADAGNYIEPRPYFYPSYFEAVDGLERRIMSHFRKSS